MATTFILEVLSTENGEQIAYIRDFGKQYNEGGSTLADYAPDYGMNEWDALEFETKKEAQDAEFYINRYMREYDIEECVAVREIRN